MHLASFPLPSSDGEFGTSATGAMPAGGLFLALTEYAVGPGELEEGIFAGRPPRALDPRLFSGQALLRPIAGQRGVQRFFSTAGRAFCLYVVVGRSGEQLLAAANDVLASLQVAARPAARTART